MEAKALFNDIALALKEGDLEKAKTLFFSDFEDQFRASFHRRGIRRGIHG